MSYDGRMNYESRLGMERRVFKSAYPLTPIEQPRMSGDGGPVHLYTPSLYKICRSKKSGLQLGTHDRGKVTCKACLKLMNLSVPHQQPPCGSPAGDGSSMDAVRDSDAKIHLSAMQCSSSGSTPALASAGAGLFLAEPGDTDGS